MKNGPPGRIDFNADIGESFAGYELGLDSEIVKYITSANIATGFHAGDPDWMARTVSLAVENGVGIGAHPAYPDLGGSVVGTWTLRPTKSAMRSPIRSERWRRLRPLENFST